MSPEEQEALSIRYARGWWVVPLSTGRVAVFDHPMGELVDIIDVGEVLGLKPRPPAALAPALGLEVEVEL